MKISRRQLRKIILEQMSVVGKPEGGGQLPLRGQYPESIAGDRNKELQYDALMAAERRVAEYGSADEMPQSVKDIAAEVVRTISLPADIAADGASLVYHTHSAATHALNDDFESAEKDMSEAAVAFGMLLTPRLLTNLLRLLKALVRQGKNLVEIVEQMLRKIQMDPIHKHLDDVSSKIPDSVRQRYAKNRRNVRMTPSFRSGEDLSNFLKNSGFKENTLYTAPNWAKSIELKGDAKYAGYKFQGIITQNQATANEAAELSFILVRGEERASITSKSAAELFKKGGGIQESENYFYNGWLLDLIQEGPDLFTKAGAGKVHNRKDILMGYDHLKESNNSNTSLSRGSMYRKAYRRRYFR